MRRVLARHDGAVLAGAVLVAYVLLLWWFDGLPYQDVPNHLSRGVVIADLLFDGGARFGTVYEFEWSFMPYILGDAFHALTVRVLPPDVAARLWVSVAFASFPLATLLLLRTWGAPPAVCATGVLAAAFLGADWFLRLGFLNFRYGLALALLAVVAWERMLARPSVPRVLLYALAVVAAYLMHLAALALVIVLIGMLSLVRLVRERRGLVAYALAGGPLLAFLGWHMLFQPGQEVGASLQPLLVTKVFRTAGALAPTRQPLEIVAALGFIGTVTLTVLVSQFRGWPARAWEALAVAAAFGVVYLVLPEQRGEVWGMDIRALPMLWLFLAIAAAFVVQARERGVLALRHALAAVALLHLAVLGGTLGADNATMRDYRAMAALVPEGATVLPVVTATRRGSVSPTAHAGSFATIDRAAVVPYTFTGNQGAPMLYFRFREKPPPFPWQWWYLNEAPVVVGHTLVSGYDYLLIEQPIDWARLPHAIDVVAANDAVVLARPRARAPRLAEQSAP